MQNAFFYNLWSQIRSLLLTTQTYIWQRVRQVWATFGCIKNRHRKSMQIEEELSENIVDKTTCQVIQQALPTDVEKGSVFDKDDELATNTQTERDVPTAAATQEGSPLSLKSNSYSQKSTVSAKSCGSHCAKISEPFGELIVDDIEEEVPQESPAPLEEAQHHESNNSLHTIESIKTQLEDNTPQISRAQSLKSLPIEEDLEGSNSFVVVEEVPEQELESTPPETIHKVASPVKQVDSTRVMNSRSISLDSLYGRVGSGRPASKQGSLDTTSTSTTTTTDNTSQSCKTMLHIPLKSKAKTSYLLRGQRRVSPVKQALKMSPKELFPFNMTRFDKPREALLKTFDQLDSSNWEVNMSGLKSMVRLIRYHSDFLDSHMHMTCIQLTRSVRNLRSQVARASCQAAAELFIVKSKYLEQECDDLVCALLLRTADTNRFLRADATKALESLVDHAQPSKILNILSTKGAQHQNAAVRTTTAKLMFRLVERLGSERVYAMGREQRDKFFVVGANLLLEGSLETRSYAKSLFRALSEHNSYQRLLLEVIPPRTYRNVEKTLRSLTR